VIGLISPSEVNRPVALAKRMPRRNEAKAGR